MSSRREIKERLAQAIGVDELDESAGLLDAGANSMIVAIFVAEFENDFDARLDLSQVRRSTSIAELIDHAMSRLAS